MPRKGYRPSEEHRAKIAASMRERMKDPAEREKRAAALRGRKLSERHRRRVSRGVIRYWALRERV